MMSEWINVETALKEEGLVYDGENVYHVVWCDIHKEWVDWSEQYEQIQGVTHWMPLPNPPEVNDV